MFIYNFWLVEQCIFAKTAHHNSNSTCQPAKSVTFQQCIVVFVIVICFQTKQRPPCFSCFRLRVASSRVIRNVTKTLVKVIISDLKSSVGCSALHQTHCVVIDFSKGKLYFPIFTRKLMVGHHITRRNAKCAVKRFKPR